MHADTAFKMLPSRLTDRRRVFAFGVFVTFVFVYLGFIGKNMSLVSFPKPYSDGHSGGGRLAEPPFEVGHIGAVDNITWDQRAEEVKSAFKFAYSCYAKTAFGSDELLPIANKTTNSHNGWGTTIVNSIDVMVLMDLKDELASAIEHVAGINISVTSTRWSNSIHFLETTIRYMGGYLSAYHLLPPSSSDASILLTQALNLGSVLLRAFNTSSGLPWPSVLFDPVRDPSASRSVLLSVIGSCQVEFKYLAHLTGDARFWKAADSVTRLMYDQQSKSVVKGIWGDQWDVHTGLPSRVELSMGGRTNSAYDYLLKQYILSGRTEKYLLKMYIEAMDSIIENMLYLSPNRELLYVTGLETWPGHPVVPTGTFEHISCSLPGLFALGADQLDEAELDVKRRQKYQWVAEGLAYTCYLIYAEQRYGLGPELVRFKALKSKNWGQALKDWEASPSSTTPGAKPPGVGNLPPVIRDWHQEHDYRGASGDHMLRGEAIESVYLLWKTTKDEVWRERGWEMWDAVSRATRTKNGFAWVRNLDGPRLVHWDHQPSSFLAKTLKYYYLLFSNADPWPLSKYVFNAEAHPLPIYHLRDWEKRRFRVSAM
ncbi:seven-hairpin glycosidase [Auriculariales sp. MPI-PUGE-AT-0066]|nr:seven-hairpin glycosidase [Auriculariales sp. MPI-PUGE-AT-0066]